ncbi:MAG: MBL fold metallo-hydrolase [Oscillospiraceae bacterium]|nr:MBL fold metallo-hydrolase [Oscillospiraceae bacterium]
MKLTWLGCAAYKIDMEDGNVLWTDPFFSMTKRCEYHTDEDSFADAQEILISHGHFDHLISVPEYNSQREIRVHCTETPHDTLLRHGVPEERLHCCEVGDSFCIGKTCVSLHQGRHNVLDLKIALQAAARAILSPFEFFKLVAAHKKFPENGETVVFNIEHDGRRLLSLGSPGIPDDDVDAALLYADLLILPYNGTSNPAEMALRIVEYYQPQAVVLSHHDNAFPPLTGAVDTQAFVRAMAVKYPEIPVTVPNFAQEMSLEHLTSFEQAARRQTLVRSA